MSVLLETSAGDIVIDLLVDEAPKLCENFLKLCKMKYYNFSPIFHVLKDFVLQTGDPLGPLSSQSDGGSSIWGLVSGDSSLRTFAAPFHPKLKHREKGTVSMATVPLASNSETRLAASQFVITLGDDTGSLDGKTAVFGKVAEGFDTLDKINEAMVDEHGYPFMDIRIKHTFILDDPFPDPPGLRQPSSSPPPTDAQFETMRLVEADLHKYDGLDEEEIENRRRQKEAQSSALILELLGDLPFAEVQPPENVLFVCKLNPITNEEDLQQIFGRFGKILSCEVIRDYKTGDSLQYSFIEYEDKKSCEAAYSKMDNVLIDDRRIHVDFSQSVSKLSGAWRERTNFQRKALALRGGSGGVQRDGRDRRSDDRPPRGAERGPGGRRHHSRSRSPPKRDRSRERERYPRDRRERDRDPRERDGRGNRYYQNSERHRERDRERDRGRDRESDRDREWGRDRARDRDRDREHRRHDSYRSRR
ncbi:RNA recognition domain-containing protein [Ophiocordyceps camponoti-floridani]|uniref:Peptidyl-prolyl cis-trans isomerase n=1 Tax=Ophiocordyceps camponoti-floridani TaxID=2030778 RepID=A0A8H4Q217_9HYPO|nr:RNA recognition domain-containing protein [Ophiocordyceps camponoti-floridani]